ncbi:MAG: thioredoxin family protein [Terrimicrobiaceae bacterium]|nr:thioredoxin family protein [Terrimicrobiaceae bacterium]
MKIPAALFFAVTFLAAGIVRAAPEVGKPAPDFTLRDSAGQPRSLAEFKGRTVVLEWFNEGCPFVRKHYDSGSMQALQKQATDDGVAWLTIVSSAPGKQGYLTPEQAAAKKKELHSTALLLDPDGAVGHAYEARTTPDLFVIDGSGALVYKGAIDDQPTPDPASLTGARNYVAAALAAIKAGQPVSPSQTKSYGCSVKY